MSLCTELSHPNVVHLAEIILEDKCVFMVFEYCEHDLLQIIHHHTQPTRRPIPATMIKSILFQLLNGLYYLHQNWVIHRDLKPANIMVTSSGHVRIGDLGLARLFHKPLSSLYSGDKVVVTIWYRSPDLLLGARHYTPSIDLWAVGCIFAELLSLRPIFKGEETKMDSKKTVPFQRNQMGKIVEILGMPRRENWKGLVDMPEYPQLQSLIVSRGGMPGGLYPNPPTSLNRGSGGNNGSGLESWYNNCIRHASYPPDKSPGQRGFQLLSELFEYDPDLRLTAEQALHHEYFRNTDDGPNKGKIWVSNNCFEGLNEVYPHRRVSTETNDIGTGSLPGTKRGGLPDDTLLPASKRR
ncbi:Serine/threonine-protein kinase ssn3 [Fonsecaea pedrosoi]|nr:Serine/threonine-protein kinase ssn3 [Fonsecaea pedrosoi]